MAHYVRHLLDSLGADLQHFRKTLRRTFSLRAMIAGIELYGPVDWELACSIKSFVR